MIMIVAVLFSILAISSSFLQPRDLVDEAQDQLDQLQLLIQGEITAAHNQLYSSLNSFKIYQISAYQSAITSLYMQQKVALSELTTIKDLAETAGKDISSCTDTSEERLNALASSYQQKSQQCMSVFNRQAIAATDDAKYRVDIYINNVKHLEFQFKQCGGDLLCISPVLTEIELDKIRLPQSIEVEVQATASLLTTMRLSVKNCVDDVLVELTMEADTILDEIEACANKILS